MNFKVPFESKYTLNEIHSVSQSQAGQDLFVLAMFKGKTNGTFLEIGAGNPIGGSNCYLLENNFNWSGYSIEKNCKKIYLDLNEQPVTWNECRPNSKLICEDATTIDYSTYPEYFDYLQIDIDNSANVQTVIDKLESIKFGVITLEHDVWRKNKEVFHLRNYARQQFVKRGYILLVDGVTLEPHKNNVYGFQAKDGTRAGAFAIKEPLLFEDWYVHPDIIDSDIISSYKWVCNNFTPKYYTDILFDNK